MESSGLRPGQAQITRYSLLVEQFFGNPTPLPILSHPSFHAHRVSWRVQLGQGMDPGDTIHQGVDSERLHTGGWMGEGEWDSSTSMI